MSDRLNCRLCSFSTAKWTTKNGKRRDGFSVLRKHYISDHPTEYEKILGYSIGGTLEDAYEADPFGQDY